MNEDRSNELLERCESKIEEKLLEHLYPRLTTDHAQELQAQYKIDYYSDIITIPDFAFPYLQIAIYCDGFKSREGSREQFEKDRLQSRELQLRGWLVLRFAGREINRDIVMVVKTIERAIDQRDRERSLRSQQQQTHEEKSWQASIQRDHQRAQKHRRDTARAEFYLSRGRAAVMNNDYDRAIENLTKAIELSPAFAAPYHYRGVAYYFKAAYTRAIADYSKAIDLNPEAPDSYNGRGAAYAKKGDRDRAEEDYTMAALLTE